MRGERSQPLKPGGGGAIRHLEVALPVGAAYLPDRECVDEQGAGQHDSQFRRDLGYGCPARE